MGLGPEQDGAFPSSMLRLVLRRFVAPHIAGPVDIARTKHTDFRGPTAAETLNANHIGHHVRHVRECSVNRCVVDWFNWVRIGEGALTTL